MDKIWAPKSELVKKPWGFERRSEISGSIALTQLFIDSTQQTSLHCHPTKTTSMVCLRGRGVINFFNSKFDLEPGNGFTIRNGLFHQIINTSGEDKLHLLEFENPPDKFDLIRFSDSYGREDLAYEESALEEPLSIPNLDLDEFMRSEGEIDLGSMRLRVFQFTKEIGLKLCLDSQFVVLDGGIIDIRTGHLVLRPADFIRRDTLERLLSRFQTTDAFKLLELRNS